MHLPNSDEIAALAKLWNFRFLKAMPELTSHFVAHVQMQGTGQNAVLKIGTRKTKLDAEVRWLRHYPKITPEVLQFDPVREAYLMIECLPGQRLKSWLKPVKTSRPPK